MRTDPTTDFAALPLMPCSASDLRTPKAHKKHTDGIPCGCWTGQKNVTSCRWCGACYDALEVVEFRVFRCYDCGGGVNTNIMPHHSLPNA